MQLAFAVESASPVPANNHQTCPEVAFPGTQPPNPADASQSHTEDRATLSRIDLVKHPQQDVLSPGMGRAPLLRFRRARLIHDRYHLLHAALDEGLSQAPQEDVSMVGCQLQVTLRMEFLLPGVLLHQQPGHQRSLGPACPLTFPSCRYFDTVEIIRETPPSLNRTPRMPVTAAAV